MHISLFFHFPHCRVFSFHYYFLLSRQKHFCFFISENVQYNQYNSEQIWLKVYHLLNSVMSVFIEKAPKINDQNQKTGYSPYLQSILHKLPTTTVLWHHSVLPASNTKKLQVETLLKGYKTVQKFDLMRMTILRKCCCKVRCVFTQTSYIRPTRGAVLTAQVPLSLFFSPNLKSLNYYKYSEMKMWR